MRIVGCRLLSRGVFAVFGSHTVSTINTLRSFSSAFRLPFLSTGLPVGIQRSRRDQHRRRHHHGYFDEFLLEEDDDDYNDEENDDDDDVDQIASYDVYVRPVYARAVVDLLKYYHCRQAWYLYNSNEGTPNSTDFKTAQRCTREAFMRRFACV